MGFDLLIRLWWIIAVAEILVNTPSVCLGGMYGEVASFVGCK